MIGTKIAHYEILEELGRGGMGVVYRARDTELGREVAIKVLPEAFAGDSARMERFRREARSLASLNHANIAAIYGLEEANGIRAIAMELAEGETLAERIARGPLAINDALELAVQIAEALEAAHEKGVVHRDLKPANIMVSDEGQVKVLDFGLAKALEGESATSQPEDSPTLTIAATQAGMILGTAAYMSPEQACGKPVDKRADIWSFGVVLYEMLTGVQMFGGETISHMLAGVLKGPIEFSALRAGTPRAIRKLLRRCLGRDRKRRLQAIGDARLEIEEALAGETVEAPEPPAVALWRPLKWALFVVAAVILLVLASAYFGQTSPEAPLRRFSFKPPVALGNVQEESDAAISPDGKHIAFTETGTDGKLWVWDLDQQQPRSIEGTEGASRPFWSPGSDFIGFAAGGELRKVSVQGGFPVRLCQLATTSSYRGAWSPDGEVIVFSSSHPPRLYDVSAGGGTASLLISSESLSAGGTAIGITGPHFLPSEAGARVLLFTYGPPSMQTMMVQDLETGRRERLGLGSVPFYSSSGHIVYQSGRLAAELWALPFSLDSLKVVGEPFPLTQNSRDPTVAEDGTLVYLDAFGPGRQKLVWRNRRGERAGEIGLEVETFRASSVLGRNFALSPVGRLLAVVDAEKANEDVWVYDIARKAKTRVSSDPGVDFGVVWSPSGEDVAFSSARSGNRDIFAHQADGSGEEKVLLATPDNETASDWAGNGKYLLYWSTFPKTGHDLWYLERKEDGSGWEPHPFLQTPSNELGGRLSPDGRFVAYASDESGQYEVYVRPFPEGEGKFTVSSSGGTEPLWSREGKELFYVEGSTLVAVSVSTHPNIAAAPEKRLFEHSSLSSSSGFPQYDVSADGRRFLVAEPVGEAPEPSIRVVQNWFAEFRDREDRD